MATQSENALNGIPVAVPAHEAVRKTIGVNDAVFEAQVIRWERRPTSEKSFLYLMNSSGELVYKVHSSLNQKPNFFTSVCVTSAWADTFSKERDLLKPDAHTPTSRTWRKFQAQLDQLNQSVYDGKRQFLPLLVSPRDASKNDRCVNLRKFRWSKLQKI